MIRAKCNPSQSLPRLLDGLEEPPEKDLALLTMNEVLAWWSRRFREGAPDRLDHFFLWHALVFTA